MIILFLHLSTGQDIASALDSFSDELCYSHSRSSSMSGNSDDHHNINKTVENILSWDSEHNIPQVAIRALMQILKPNFLNLLVDPQSFLQTPRHYNMK